MIQSKTNSASKPLLRSIFTGLTKSQARKNDPLSVQHGACKRSKAEKNISFVTDKEATIPPKKIHDIADIWKKIVYIFRRIFL
ncbi:hypothetical protein ACP4OV_013243 [Aristida adscensionis]